MVVSALIQREFLSIVEYLQTLKILKLTLYALSSFYEKPSSSLKKLNASVSNYVAGRIVVQYGKWVAGVALLF